jgi:hypothetical protein
MPAAAAVHCWGRRNRPAGVRDQPVPAVRAADGVPVKDIAALLGQSSPGETERYVHRLPGQTLAQRVGAAIDHAFPA